MKLSEYKQKAKYSDGNGISAYLDERIKMRLNGEGFYEEIFNFWGKVIDVRPAISTSSVYVLPSYREGTPRTVLEAMAMGRAVITTDAPGCRETVIDGLNGYLVPVKAVDELVAAMEKFIVNPDLLTQMGAASRQLVEGKFDVHTVNQAMLEAMEIL